MISIPFANVTDYVRKRFALEDAYQAVTREIEKTLTGDDIAKSISVFSASAFSEPILRYLLSEQLLESSSTLPVEDQRRQLKVKAGKEKGQVHFFQLNGTDKRLEPLLDLVQELYQHLPDEKKALLIGYNTDNQYTKANNIKYNPPFNTRRIIEERKIPGFSFPGRKIGMNDFTEEKLTDGYQLLESIDGMGPIIGYCCEYPVQFQEIQLKTKEVGKEDLGKRMTGRITLSPRWEKEDTGLTEKMTRADCFRIELELNDQSPERIVQLARIVDKYIERRPAGFLKKIET